MNGFFSTVLEMSGKACVVIAAVMLARLILARAPKKYSYFLWSLVALRLCVPFSISTGFSIFGIKNLFSGGNAQTVITDPVPQTIVPDTMPDIGTQDVIARPGNDPVISVSSGITLTQVLVAVWLCGIIAMLVYGIISYVLIKRRMTTATRLEGNVFCSENVLSPFALGFIRPKIYIPYGLDDVIREKIIAHEKYHIRRLDHLAKPFAFLLLAVHWFNPLCWLAFNRMSLDMEMSCDEKLLRAQGDEEMKKIYTKALLSFASNRRFPAPGPVNFNESGNAKKRISNSLNYKKPRVWVSVLAFLFCAVMLVACATDASGTTYTDINKTVFADAPYVVTYKSNGDGTCTVTDIIIDYSASGSVTVVIPEFSPDGDKVTKVEMQDLNTLATLNVPVLITDESFDAIKASLEASDLDEREIRQFVSFYDPHENEGILLLEPAIIEAEYVRLSDILVKIGYTSQNAYDAAVEVVNTVPANSDEAVALRNQAFDYFYHNANKIKCIIVPEEAEVNGTGNVTIIYRNVEKDYINVETSTAPDEESVYFDGENPVSIRKIILRSLAGMETSNGYAIEYEYQSGVSFSSVYTVTDFRLFALTVADYNDEGGFIYKMGETEYSAEAIDEAPTFFFQDFANNDYGISFVDKDGTTKYYRVETNPESGDFYLASLNIE